MTSNNNSIFELSKIISSKFNSYPICFGMTEPKHTVKQYAARGGVYDGRVFLDSISEELSKYPEVVDKLLDAHLEVEDTKQSVVLKLPDGVVLVLQNAGFEKYVEAFDVVTYFDEQFCGKTFYNKPNDVVVTA